MAITLDRVVVALLVALALGFLVRRVILSIRAARATAAGCASDCGCSAEGHKRG